MYTGKVHPRRRASNEQRWGDNSINDRENDQPVALVRQPFRKPSMEKSKSNKEPGNDRRMQFDSKSKSQDHLCMEATVLPKRLEAHDASPKIDNVHAISKEKYKSNYDFFKDSLRKRENESRPTQGIGMNSPRPVEVTPSSPFHTRRPNDSSFPSNPISRTQMMSTSGDVDTRKEMNMAKFESLPKLTGKTKLSKRGKSKTLQDTAIQPVQANLPPSRRVDLEEVTAKLETQLKVRHSKRPDVHQGRSSFAPSISTRARSTIKAVQSRIGIRGGDCFVIPRSSVQRRPLDRPQANRPQHNIRNNVVKLTTSYGENHPHHTSTKRSLDRDCKGMNKLQENRARIIGSRDHTDIMDSHESSTDIERLKEKVRSELLSELFHEYHDKSISTRPQLDNERGPTSTGERRRRGSSFDQDSHNKSISAYPQPENERGIAFTVERRSRRSSPEDDSRDKFNSSYLQLENERGVAFTGEPHSRESSFGIQPTRGPIHNANFPTMNKHEDSPLMMFPTPDTRKADIPRPNEQYGRTPAIKGSNAKPPPIDGLDSWLEHCRDSAGLAKCSQIRHRRERAQERHQTLYSQGRGDFVEEQPPQTISLHADALLGSYIVDPGHAPRKVLPRKKISPQQDNAMDSLKSPNDVLLTLRRMLGAHKGSTENNLPYCSFPKELLHVIRILPGNSKCCDCGKAERDGTPLSWASVTYGTLLCKHCAFRHITKSDEVSSLIRFIC